MNEKGLHIRLLRFMISTLGGTIVDTLVLFVCSHFIFSEYLGKVIVSPIISFEAAVLTNYTTAYLLVWKNRIANRSRQDFLHRFPGYNLSCIFSFALKMLLLIIIQHYFSWLDIVFCNLIALCFSGMLNFVLNDFIIFSSKKLSASSIHDEEPSLQS